MVSPINFNNCRLCQLYIGTIDINNTELSSKIFCCTQINIVQEEDCPKLICETCHKRIDQFYAYLQLIKQVNEELTEQALLIKTKRKHAFNCTECSRSYSKEATLKRHKQCHTAIFCVYCKTLFDNANEKSRHYCKEELLLKEAPLTIDRLSSQSEDTVQDELSFSHKCKACDKRFECNADLIEHTKSHNDLFHCTWDSCDKVCRSAYSLKTHEMRHEGKRPYLCVTCGKGFVTKNSLNCHEKIHAEIKGYTCKLCNIGFSVRSNLRAHEKKHHEGIRFYCSQCTRAFITKCSLERHERVHIGIRDYQCQTCPSAFFTRKELLKHQRYHQGLKQHKCDQCYKSFFEKHHLTIHIRSHTGERPYICKISGCNKSFAESHKLTRHLKARHPCSN